MIQLHIVMCLRVLRDALVSQVATASERALVRAMIQPGIPLLGGAQPVIPANLYSAYYVYEHYSLGSLGNVGVWGPQVKV